MFGIFGLSGKVSLFILDKYPTSKMLHTNLIEKNWVNLLVSV